MLILATKLYRTPITAPGAGKLGELGNPIVNPRNGQLLAFHVLSNSLFGPKNIISTTDIIVFDPKIIVINNPSSVINPKEVVRISESLEQKITLMKTKAYTQNKIYLGRVEDAVINSETYTIVKLYLKHFLQSRILPTDKIVEIKRNKIIFDDSVIAPNIEASGALA
jgi:uncharacterized protein YrrD